jgi:hypothetical protein
MPSFTAKFQERLKTRVPDWRRFLARAREDRRTIAYDLLPVLGLKERLGVAKAIAAFRPKTANFKPSDMARELALDLHARGLTAMQGPVPVEDLLGYFQAIPCHDPYRPHLGRFQWDQPPSDEVNIGYFTWEEVIRAPGLLELANHPDILAAAELYFGCKPVIDNIGASWSYPGRDTAKGGQRFHRDYDCARSFKLFLYVTEVDADSGPHVYVQGSHRSRLIESGRAQTDADIVSAFGAEAVTPIMAPAGSWFLEDVYGFHKGQLPKTKPRLLVAVEYNLYPSPLAPKAPILPRGEVKDSWRFDPYINRVFIS